MRDFIELFLMAIWCYGNGFVFAWLFGPLDSAKLRIAAVFGLVGMLLGFWGKEVERTRGFFPFWISYLILAIPLFCSLAGIAFWVTTSIPF